MRGFRVHSQTGHGGEVRLDYFGVASRWWNSERIVRRLSSVVRGVRVCYRVCNCRRDNAQMNMLTAELGVHFAGKRSSTLAFFPISCPRQGTSATTLHGG